MRRICVVGGSLAGLRAVEALRRLGFDGELVWVGAEAHRPYDRPPLSKQVLRGEWDGERCALRPNPPWDSLGARLLFGARATSLDTRARRVSLDDGSAVDFDGLVIATGARVRTLNGPMPAGVFTLRTLDDALALRDALAAKPRVAVVGAGFIGLEVAAACRTLGLDVTVVEGARAPLPMLGEEMGLAFTELHRARGATVTLGATVARVLGGDRVTGLALSNGATVTAEVVVVGIGVKPATEWLDGSGVAVDDGVLCDASGRTSVPGVVAAGDVARWESPIFGERLRVEHWTNAVEQANAAAAALLRGEAAPPLRAVPYFWSDQYDAKIQFAGLGRPGDERRIVEGSVADRNLVALYGRAGRLTGVLAINKPAALIRNRRAIAEGAAFDEPG